ncbi:putative Aminoacyl tRNA synthase complex-interacting multifunctional protein 2 [Hypsibius exemplaris]|uniref:Aminoacyl tRNA synthase complex-interacting multifunctional protein 2 n=1 Tax=Hypsibius exemplaris TaxID=2072580 RepID=A0A1W0WYA3_HYPEX|nr:putative Aminoacyl tRNA synthase complex-interacting multifunctional protein 2 [Hypsibius exemplaris]
MLHKSAVLDHDALKVLPVYPLPVVYDYVLEVFYPGDIYLLETVYQLPPTNVRVTRTTGTGSSQGAAMTSSSVKKVDISSGDAAAISAQILAKQQTLLGKLKSLRGQLDSIETVLRKEKSTAPPVAAPSDKGGNSVAASEASKKFTQCLELAAGNNDTVKSLIIGESENVLSRLKYLHRKVDELEQSARAAAKSAPKVAKKTSSTRAKQEELVVSADAKYPPLSLIAAANFLAEHGSVLATSYVHSSARQVPDKLRRLLGEDVSTTDSRSGADFIVSLIWKDVGIDTTLMVEPTRQNPILAEANIARYVFRILNANYDSVENLVQFTANDKWLNLAARSLVYGNAKERQSAVRQLNAHLGQQAFLTGPDVSLVDAVVVSALFNAKEYAGLGGNVKKWAHACSQTDLFAGMKEFLV